MMKKYSGQNNDELVYLELSPEMDNKQRSLSYA